MPDDIYQKRKAEDEALQWRHHVESLRKMVGEMAPADKAKAKMVVADREFSPDEILAEVEKETEYGKLFVKMQARAHMEQIRRRK